MEKTTVVFDSPECYSAHEAPGMFWVQPKTTVQVVSKFITLCFNSHSHNLECQKSFLADLEKHERCEVNADVIDLSQNFVPVKTSPKYKAQNAKIHMLEMKTSLSWCYQKRNGTLLVVFVRSYHGSFDNILTFVMCIPTRNNDSHIFRNRIASAIVWLYLSFTIISVYSDASSLLNQRNVS